MNNEWIIAVILVFFADEAENCFPGEDLSYASWTKRSDSDHKRVMTNSKRNASERGSDFNGLHSHRIAHFCLPRDDRDSSASELSALSLSLFTKFAILRSVFVVFPALDEDFGSAPNASRAGRGSSVDLHSVSSFTVSSTPSLNFAQRAAGSLFLVIARKRSSHRVKYRKSFG
jgi:hypothetical protein